MLEKEWFGFKAKYWITVFLVPIAINILVWVPNPLAIGDFETWVGFFGNYAGGIVGAFIALLIAKSQTDLALLQFNQEKQRVAEEKEEAKNT